MPNTSLKVCEPRPNSGVLVLPMTMQPAAFMRSTISASAVGHVIAPAAASRAWSGCPSSRPASLIACGMPCIQPMRLAARELRVARVGLAQQVVAVPQADDRVDLGIDRGDAGERGLHHLAARDRLGMDGVRQRVRVEVGDVHRAAVGGRYRALPALRTAADERGAGLCRPHQREPNIICRAIADLTGPSACSAAMPRPRARAGAGQLPGEAAGEEIGRDDHRPAVGRALPFEAAQHRVDIGVAPPARAPARRHRAGRGSGPGRRPGAASARHCRCAPCGRRSACVRR